MATTESPHLLTRAIPEGGGASDKGLKGEEGRDALEGG